MVASAILMALMAALVVANQPPRFEVTDESGGEIVLKLKEGGTPVGSVIYRIKAFDADGDTLQFGLQGQVANELLRIQPVGDNEADLQLIKELDREVNSVTSNSLFLNDVVVVVYFNSIYVLFRRKKSILWY